ncbi:MAG: 3-methyl-2-oxobutanoate hydroxymethyltransferase [Legionellales bacterium RIFCSPHIGHO2_12_FULL_35_11]|nr:MAG: 3-methyl-2-oxobutanoate hydroxymethyltransferase [Legionellales bacterium RIFCSPHIGHO2_12_FULL_35_11]
MKLHHFKQKKLHHHKISMLTCYDFPSAKIISESNVDAVLVGDSVAMTVYGYESTVHATMEMINLHTAAVRRGVGKKFLISDLPFLSYRESRAQTMLNVKQLIQAGAQAVKLEGGDPELCNTIKHIVTSGVPVMGHIGLTPQSIMQIGGYKVQGRTIKQADIILEQALNLEKSGCFAIVLECIPEDLAKKITETLTIPTIGIGAGKNTDGQILVWHDLLGMQSEVNLKFVKRYTESKEIFFSAINEYADEVKELLFPSDECTFKGTP